GTITSLAFHPGGALLASAAKDRSVRLWNPATGQALKVLEGHTAWVQGIQFLSRGTRLASTGADQTIRVWGLDARTKSSAQPARPRRVRAFCSAQGYSAGSMAAD